MKRKGFTLAELLVTIIILGILASASVFAISSLVNRSKEESIEAQKKSFLMATKSYAESHPEVLPSAIGQTKKVYAKDIKRAKYLKDNIKNSDGKSCMEHSYVNICKYDTAEYTYSVYINCEGETPTEEKKPIITITMDSNDVATIELRDGGEEMDIIGLASYNYTIIANYKSEGSSIPLEVYQSDSIKLNGEKVYSLTIDLSPYEDKETMERVSIIVQAYNKEGGHSSSNSEVNTNKEIQPPTAVTISGGETKIYGSKETILTCETSSTYPAGTNLYYSFGYATAENEEAANWTENTTSSTLAISPTEYIGQRWYSCRAYASDGIILSETIDSSSESATKVTIHNATLIFDATTNGGTGGGEVYTKKGATVVYTKMDNTATTTIPTASRKLYTLNGWYTAASGGNKVLNADGNFTETAVTGYTTQSSWDVIDNKTLYAQYVASGTWHYTLSYSNVTVCTGRTDGAISWCGWDCPSGSIAWSCTSSMSTTPSTNGLSSGKYCWCYY